MATLLLCYLTACSILFFFKRKPLGNLFGHVVNKVCSVYKVNAGIPLMASVLIHPILFVGSFFSRKANTTAVEEKPMPEISPDLANFNDLEDMITPLD